MTTPPQILAEGELTRRAQPWHALAKMRACEVDAIGDARPLFARGQRSLTAKPKQKDGKGLHVRGTVPVDCLHVADVMD